jgi:phosphoglycolate phosphatase-like HAD superfamily hydrolase
MTCHRRHSGPPATRAPARLVVFDFDGTLSWLRHGWPRIMTAVLRARLPAQAGEDEAAVSALLAGIVLGLNGHPTIVQMTRFAALVRERGGPALEPEALRAEYQARLDTEIAARVAGIRAGRAAADDFVVCGARPLLERLAASGAVLAVLSSTVEERVREEAGVLGLTGYFAGRIHGCVGDPTTFTKRAVFARLLAETGCSGGELLSFGDGPVEIAETRLLGGTAIAVCSDEDDNGCGVCDPFKREQLLRAGAHEAIPDFRDADAALLRLGVAVAARA